MTEASTAVIRFRMAGALRFLSHAETMRVLQRACARADWPVRYSQGFNPHPRMSLPLPRPVGVEAEEELLLVRLEEEGEPGPVQGPAERETVLRQALATQLPEGMDLWAVDLVPANASFHPLSAEYVLPLRVPGAQGTQKLEEDLARILAQEHCLVQRAAEGRATRTIDVRPFLQSIRWEGGNLIVRHRTDGAGSIRVEEILQLFGLHTQDLAGPVRRTNVVWENTKSETTAEEPCMETRAEDIEDGT